MTKNTVGLFLRGKIVRKWGQSPFSNEITTTE